MWILIGCQILQLNFTSTSNFQPLPMPPPRPAVDEAANLPKQTERFWADYIHQYPSTDCLRWVDGGRSSSSLQRASRRLPRLQLAACSLHVRYSGLGEEIYRQHHSFPCRWAAHLIKYQILHSCLGHSLLASTRLGTLMPSTLHAPSHPPRRELISESRKGGTAESRICRATECGNHANMNTLCIIVS